LDYLSEETCPTGKSQDAEFLEKWQYIRNNPVKEGLAFAPEEYPRLYEKGE
jgi:hypothetical protein